MTELTAIPSAMLRSVSELELVCENIADQSVLISQPILNAQNEILKASQISSRLLPRNYIAGLPESRQQGLLSALYDLQIRVADFTAYASVSLAAFESGLAVFSCLAMISKYHQDKRQTRDYILCCDGVPEVADIAAGFEYAARLVKPGLIENQLDQHCAAIVIPFGTLQSDNCCLDSIREKLADWDVPLFVDGSGQYLPVKDPQLDSVKADILHLDLAHICGLDNGANAILCNTKFDQYLPLPIVQQDDKQLRWATASDRPFSIGPPGCSPMNFQAALHCLVYFRSQGVETIRRQAQQSMLIAGFVEMRLADAGLEIATQSGASGRVSVLLADNAQNRGVLQRLIVDLVALPLRQGAVLDIKHQKIHFSVMDLHQLNLVQLDQLIELFILHLGKK